MPAPREGGEQLGQAIAAVLVADANHRLQDHLHRDRPHPRPEGERLIERPAPELSGCDLGDNPFVVANRLAVKGRQEQAAGAQMALAVENEEAVGAERAEHLGVGLPCPHEVGIGGEELTD